MDPETLAELENMDPETLAELDAKKAELSDKQDEWKSKHKKSTKNCLNETDWYDIWEPKTASGSAERSSMCLQEKCEALLDVSLSSKTDQSTNHALTCKNCGSPEFEEEKGSKICTSCGTVLAESTLIFEETTGGSAQADVEEEKGSKICTSCGTVLAESTFVFEETTGGSAQADGSMHVDGDTGSDDSQNFQNKASEISSSENELDFEE
uniref:TFIIB-type domain-containing protein n=1 Tax=Acrobeloides nanus TaxID=290746 RepID=A0A914CNJ8_9BILA